MLYVCYTAACDTFRECRRSMGHSNNGNDNNNLRQVLATVAVGLTLVVMTSVSGGLVDKAGRRSLMIIGTVVMALALAILSGSLFSLNEYPKAQGYLVSVHSGSSARAFGTTGFGHGEEVRGKGGAVDCFLAHVI